MIRNFSWEAWLFRPSQKLPNCTIFHSYFSLSYFVQPLITSSLALFLHMSVFGFWTIKNNNNNQSMLILMKINYQHIFRLECLSQGVKKSYRADWIIAWRGFFAMRFLFLPLDPNYHSNKGYQKFISYSSFVFSETFFYNKIVNWFLIENKINTELFISETINWNLRLKIDVWEVFLVYYPIQTFHFCHELCQYACKHIFIKTKIMFGLLKT